MLIQLEEMKQHEKAKLEKKKKSKWGYITEDGTKYDSIADVMQALAD